MIRARLFVYFFLRTQHSHVQVNEPSLHPLRAPNGASVLARSPALSRRLVPNRGVSHERPLRWLHRRVVGSQRGLARSLHVQVRTFLPTLYAAALCCLCTTPSLSADSPSPFGAFLQTNQSLIILLR